MDKIEKIESRARIIYNALLPGCSVTNLNFKANEIAGGSALMFAIKSRRIEIVKKLLKQKKESIEAFNLDYNANMFYKMVKDDDAEMFDLIKNFIKDNQSSGDLKIKFITNNSKMSLFRNTQSEWFSDVSLQTLLERAIDERKPRMIEKILLGGGINPNIITLPGIYEYDNKLEKLLEKIFVNTKTSINTDFEERLLLLLGLYKRDSKKNLDYFSDYIDLETTKEFNQDWFEFSIFDGAQTQVKKLFFTTFYIETLLLDHNYYEIINNLEAIFGLERIWIRIIQQKIIKNRIKPILKNMYKFIIAYIKQNKSILLSDEVIKRGLQKTLENIFNNDIKNNNNKENIQQFENMSNDDIFIEAFRKLEINKTNIFTYMKNNELFNIIQGFKKKIYDVIIDIHGGKNGIIDQVEFILNKEWELRNKETQEIERTILIGNFYKKDFKKWTTELIEEAFKSDIVNFKNLINNTREKFNKELKPNYILKDMLINAIINSYKDIKHDIFIAIKVMLLTIEKIENEISDEDKARGQGIIKFIKEDIKDNNSNVFYRGLGM